MVSAYKYDLTKFQLFQSTVKALNRKTMEAIEEVYYKSLRDPDEGYSTLRYIDLIVHLNKQYGKLTNDDPNKNFERMNAKWTPTQPIEQLFHQIDDAVSFSKDHGPISAKATVHSAQKNLENSCVFPLAVKDWRNKLKEVQTWANFQVPPKNHQMNPFLIKGDCSTYMSYCFSHGIQWDLNHNSFTCWKMDSCIIFQA
ncbi:hypothetical protein SEMRO_2051_G312600.1 [Seminavis robusta]|uniref:Uncharacterized protein n=1 Tax=Seminavis robusta TaxID=568900 RepID=A0A9N8EV37_9STRA|nr:hypothetical protein SEMRO_2051_G312600.1 [Seminavis robusta]|eukprot:Sro2051_g312600.1 n/a (198) ;mRNA; r:3646-4239